MMHPAHDVDAWLDDVKRWYYGGTPPERDRGSRQAPVCPPDAGSPADRAQGRPAGGDRQAGGAPGTGHPAT